MRSPWHRQTTRRMTLSSAIKAAAAVALLLGSASAVLAAQNDGKVTDHVHRMERMAPPMFHGRDVEVPPLPNWGFGCDPDLEHGMPLCSGSACLRRSWSADILLENSICIAYRRRRLSPQEGDRPTGTQVPSIDFANGSVCRCDQSSPTMCSLNGTRLSMVFGQRLDLAI
jgi:hypothetical protein